MEFELEKSRLLSSTSALSTKQSKPKIELRHVIQKFDE